MNEFKYSAENVVSLAAARANMNEYNLVADDDEGIAYSFNSSSHELAINAARDHINGLSEWGAVWRLSMTEREENPELHNCLDAEGARHDVPIHKFWFDAKGKLLDDSAMWDDAADITVTEI